eukprot:5749808-Amphidinium_carterae.1
MTTCRRCGVTATEEKDQASLQLQREGVETAMLRRISSSAAGPDVADMDAMIVMLGDTDLQIH